MEYEALEAVEFAYKVLRIIETNPYNTGLSSSEAAEFQKYLAQWSGVTAT